MKKSGKKKKGVRARLEDVQNNLSKSIQDVNDNLAKHAEDMRKDIGWE